MVTFEIVGTVLKALLCIDSIASERYAGISCHTWAAYSKTDLILLVYTLSMSSGITPARFNNLSAYSQFSHDVTTAMFVPLDKEMAAIFVSRPNPLGIELYHYANVFFCFR